MYSFSLWERPSGTGFIKLKYIRSFWWGCFQDFFSFLVLLTFSKTVRKYPCRQISSQKGCQLIFESSSICWNPKNVQIAAHLTSLWPTRRCWQMAPVDITLLQKCFSLLCQSLRQEVCECGLLTVFHEWIPCEAYVSHISSF